MAATRSTPVYQSNYIPWLPVIDDWTLEEPMPTADPAVIASPADARTGPLPDQPPARPEC